MNEILNAIRNDPTIGRDSCSVVDECYTDEEILKATEGMTPAEALEHFLYRHKVWADVMEDHLGEVF